MIVGAGAICTAKASESEQGSWRAAMERECARYGMDSKRVASSLLGEDPLAQEKPKRRWWEAVIVGSALALFVWLAMGATHQAIEVNPFWMATLLVLTFVCLIVAGVFLWRRTRFS
jgi:peptidoglycan/LPS O-acetylase OafA/YrhL